MSTLANASKRIRSNKRILKVVVKRMADNDPDTSWLGEYSNSQTSPFSIDRKHSEDCIENDTLQKEKLERIASWIENERPCCEEHPREFSEGCPACVEERYYQNAEESVRELIECDCGEHGDMSRNEYRFFNPSFNYVDKDGNARPENTPAEVRKYVRQDYDRMESLNRGDWCFLGIRVEAEVQLTGDLTQTITSGGLWGIESDSGKDHIQETIREEMANLKTELLALGFSKRAIATAFKNVEEVSE